ncbi:MAG TPA: hypothetical protein VMT30_07480 [Candidatus Saccharimonadia bacterium]|nr:hypothetical protein [Candidatus Saccharimonadia bacterium]
MSIQQRYDASASASPSSFHTDFDGDRYNDHYVNGVGAEDAQIIDGLVGWVVDQLQAGTLEPHSLEGPHLDVGPAKTRHWPAILEVTMAPGAQLHEVEFGRGNVAGLQKALLQPLDQRWLPQEAAMVAAGGGAYGPYWQGVLQRLRARSVVSQGSIYDLPRAHYGSGSMFFVACSIASSKAMFDAAVAAFIRSLRPGAPFVAAFMEKSQGYAAGAGTSFPACSVSKDEICEAVARYARVDLCERTTALSEGKVREGYEAMVDLAGWAR